MSRIDQIFGTSHVLLPVVHPTDRDGTLRSIDIVHAAGAKGAFLIDQGMPENEVLALVVEARKRYPKLWLGVNLLSREPREALAVAREACGQIDGIWSDNAGIDERADMHPRAEAFAAARGDWNGLWFGGVPFKYQREVAAADLGRAAGIAGRYMDVICTSGPGTGFAADVDKPRAMHAGANGAAIALASGVTAENVRSYMPYVQAFLVGTYIEDRFGVINRDKLAALMHAMQK